MTQKYSEVVESLTKVAESLDEIGWHESASSLDEISKNLLKRMIIAQPIAPVVEGVAAEGASAGISEGGSAGKDFLKNFAGDGNLKKIPGAVTKGRSFFNRLWSLADEASKTIMAGGLEEAQTGGLPQLRMRIMQKVMSRPELSGIAAFLGVDPASMAQSQGQKAEEELIKRYNPFGTVGIYDPNKSQDLDGTSPGSAGRIDKIMDDHVKRITNQLTTHIEPQKEKN